MEPDLERRLERIEKKLDERVVFRDVYDANQRAMWDAIARAESASTRETDRAAELMAATFAALRADVEAHERRIERIESNETARSRVVTASVFSGLLALAAFLLERTVA